MQFLSSLLYGKRVNEKLIIVSGNKKVFRERYF